MKPHNITSLNAFSLIAMSSWGYLASATPSITSMIPAGIGLILLFSYTGIKKQNAIVVSIAVFLTLLILVAFYWPLVAVIKKENYLGVFRVAFMMATCLISLVVLVKHLMRSRRNSA